MTMNKDGVILPCPFCGNADVFPSSWDVKCSKCGAEMPGDTPQAIAAWNRRAPAVVTVDEIAQLIREVDGDNTMGAGQLAEALLGRLVPAALSVRAEPVAVKPDPWVDTRLVRFDDTIVFGHGGFDFDRWESLRWEMHTPEGSWAVWKSDTDRWSMYGAPHGLLALDKYASEEHAKADAEECARSLSEWYRSALVASPAPTTELASHETPSGETQTALVSTGETQTGKAPIPSIPAGYRLVPEEPTRDMLDAGKEDLGWDPSTDSDISAEEAAKFNALQDEVLASVYSAMLSAAPSQSQVKGEGE